MIPPVGNQADAIAVDRSFGEPTGGVREIVGVVHRSSAVGEHRRAASLQQNCIVKLQP